MDLKSYANELNCSLFILFNSNISSLFCIQILQRVFPQVSQDNYLIRQTFPQINRFANFHVRDFCHFKNDKQCAKSLKRLELPNIFMLFPSCMPVT